MQQPNELALTPIYAAIKDNNITQLVNLINQGLDIEESHLQHSNPLHYAISIGRTEAVGILLDSGCNKEASDLTGSTPLHHAIYRNNLAVVKTLLDMGADKEVWNPYGSTPLNHAIYYGYKDIVKALLDSDADPEKADQDGNIPLRHAISRVSNTTNDPYNLNLEQISLDLTNAGADITNPCIQNDIRCRYKYHLMMKLVKLKSENLNLEGMCNLVHLTKYSIDPYFLNPIKSHCMALYLFKHAIENNTSSIIKKFWTNLHGQEITDLRTPIKEIKEHTSSPAYSLLKCQLYDSKAKLSEQIEEFKEFRLSKEVLQTNFPISNAYEKWILPTLSLLELIDNTTSPLDYLQTRVEKLSGQPQEFAPIPHTLRILEFLSSKDTIKLASISKNPFAVFFSIKPSDPQPSDGHDEQIVAALGSIHIGEYNDKPSEETL